MAGGGPVPVAVGGGSLELVALGPATPAVVVIGSPPPAGGAAALPGPARAPPERVPAEFLCPITLELMEDPVVLPSGQT